MVSDIVVPECTGDVPESDDDDNDNVPCSVGVNLESDEEVVSADYGDEFDYVPDDYVGELADGVLKYLSLQKNRTEFLFSTLYGNIWRASK